MRYNIRLTKKIGHNVDRVIRYFNKNFTDTIKITKEFIQNGYNIEIEASK